MLSEITYLVVSDSLKSVSEKFCNTPQSYWICVGYQNTEGNFPEGTIYEINRSVREVVSG